MNKELINIGICDEESDDLISLAEDIASERYNTSDKAVVYPILNSLYIVNKIGILSLIDDAIYSAFGVAETFMEGLNSANKSIARKSNIIKLFNQSFRAKSEADVKASHTELTNILRRLKLLGFDKVSDKSDYILDSLKVINNTVLTVSDYTNPCVMQLDDSLFLDEIINELGGYEEVLSKIEETLKDEEYIHKGLNFITVLSDERLIINNFESVTETGDIIINSCIADNLEEEDYQSTLSFNKIKEAFEKCSQLEEESEEEFSDSNEKLFNFHVVCGERRVEFNIATMLKALILSIYVYNTQKNHPYIEAIAPRLSIYKEVRENTIQASGTIYQLIDKFIQQSRNDITVNKDTEAVDEEEAYNIDINI